MTNYLTPVLIEDERLTPDLMRIRNGSHQVFYKSENRSFESDFVIEPPLKHVYAELTDGQWYWVNGCDECHGREGTWLTYIKCEKHDVCHQCKTSRKELKQSVWGHPK